MQNQSVKAVIFDMDGVLINSEPHHLIIERDLFAALNLDISEEEHKSYLGKSTLLMWTEIEATHKMSVSALELAARNKGEIVSHFSNPGNIELMPGVIEILEFLYQKNIPLALASSAEQEVIENVLEAAGLKKYFRFMVSCSTSGKSKPAPDVYLHTSVLLSLSPQECLVIEDSLNGIKAAKSAGMICIGYKAEITSDRFMTMADEYMDDFSQLPSLLMKYCDI